MSEETTTETKMDDKIEADEAEAKADLDSNTSSPKIPEASAWEMADLGPDPEGDAEGKEQPLRLKHYRGLIGPRVKEALVRCLKRMDGAPVINTVELLRLVNENKDVATMTPAQQETVLRAMFNVDHQAYKEKYRPEVALGK